MSCIKKMVASPMRCCGLRHDECIRLSLNPHARTVNIYTNMCVSAALPQCMRQALAQQSFACHISQKFALPQCISRVYEIFKIFAGAQLSDQREHASINAVSNVNNA